jgi:hypothetical protein
MDKDYLLLKRAALGRPFGKWNDDNYDVLAEEADASLRGTDWVAIGGIADMPGALRTFLCDAIDPQAT